MTSRQLTVSVLIPVFNEDQYLPKCLESLIVQSRVPDEVIICDNNSTDHSLVVARRFKSRLPLKIIKQPVKGITPTLEAGWRHATKDIIIRTDADAYFPKDWIKNIVSHFSGDRTLAALAGPWESSDGSFLIKTLIKYGYYLAEAVSLLTRGQRQMWGCNMAVRTRIMKQINGYSPLEIFLTDDRLIAEKLYRLHLKTGYFPDCRNYHSTRRYNANPVGLLRSISSAFFPKLYLEKTV